MEVFFLILCLLTMTLIYIYSENQLLITRRYSINSGKTPSHCLKLVQISDIHKKNCEKKLVLRVRQLNPDIILLTGDIVSRTEKHMYRLDYLTKKLSAICPVFAVPGNHELDLPTDIYESYKQTMKKNGICYLENKQTVFGNIAIAGASLKKSVYKNADGKYNDLEQYTAAELEKDIGKKEKYTILLAHNPLCADAYREWGADVVFSGHVHGGAVRLPFMGGLLSPERKFFPKYSKGLYRLDKTNMIVSGGIGKIRIFNPPEIVYCELYF